MLNIRSYRTKLKFFNIFHLYLCISISRIACRVDAFNIIRMSKENVKLCGLITISEEMPPALTTARARTQNILLVAGVGGHVRNFPLQIPLTLHENSGNVSGKFFQRNNCHSRDIAGESRPRAGSMLPRENTEKERGRERKKGENTYYFSLCSLSNYNAKCIPHGFCERYHKYKSAF